MFAIEGVGTVIEYSNGQRATIVWCAWAGNCADGHFIAEQNGLYAACWLDMESDEEVWCFVNEDEPWRECEADALMDLDIHAGAVG